MEILIVEDELKTAKALGHLITEIEPGSQIVALIQSVEGAVSFLQDNPAPDLIFMDVQLADGLCFEIFKAVRIASPIVFCTAYDAYALEAFKANGIDYVLKPFSGEGIAAAIGKVHQLKNFFQTHSSDIALMKQLLSSLGQRGKKGFLVFKQQKYQTVPTEQIAFFYIRNDKAMIMTLDAQEFPLTQSLDEVHQQLDPKDFFRLNRQYLISFNAIKHVEHYFARKLNVHMRVSTPEKLLVGKDKSTLFLNWLSSR